MKYWLIEQVAPQKGHFNAYHVSFPYRYERLRAVNTSPDNRLQKQTLEMSECPSLDQVSVSVHKHGKIFYYRPHFF